MNAEDLEESLIGFYAVRVPEASEALWRSDFHRAWELYALANQASDVESTAALREQARTIQDRWEADPAVRREWFELAEIRQEWIYEPADMQRKVDAYLMPGGRRPAGMRDELWRSHLQARAMTGHGQWLAPEASTTTVVEVASDVDDPFIARYADRVSDENEVLWRADFARAMDHDDRAFDEDASLLPRARAIEAQWSTDPAVGPHWRELTEIHDAWIQAPDAMKQAHEVFMPGGLQPPGMSDTRWSSHMQAREMTGHGAWPGHEPTFSTDVSERHEPMTDTTDRNALADEFTTESDAEQLMRHDFTHWAAVGDRHEPEDNIYGDEMDRREYSATWVDHGEDRWLEEWVTLSNAYLDYRDDPAAADAKRAQLGDTLSPSEARSWDQARDLAVNGIERDDIGLVSSHYVTRVPYERAQEIRAQQFTLADVHRAQTAHRSGQDRGADADRVSLSPGMEAARDDEALPQSTRDRIAGWQQTPEHYRDQGASESEAMMRADFGWRVQMRQDADRLATFAEQRPLLDRCDEIDRRWAADPEHHENWWELKESLRNWRQAPDDMASDANEDRTPIQARTYEQTRQIFEAEWHATDRVPGPSCDYARYTPENPVPSFGASVAARTSALAGYTTHGNALAAAMERQDERAGADR